jgi:hypothetical protein
MSTTILHRNSIAPIAKAMIFKYRREGDAIAQVWLRRPLNDLTGWQLSNGLFAQSSGDIFGFHQGEVGKGFGMLMNGRAGGQVNYPLEAEPIDRTACERLVNGLINSLGGRSRARSTSTTRCRCIISTIRPRSFQRRSGSETIAAPGGDRIVPHGRPGS